MWNAGKECHHFLTVCQMNIMSKDYRNHTITKSTTIEKITQGSLSVKRWVIYIRPKLKLCSDWLQDKHSTMPWGLGRGQALFLTEYCLLWFGLDGIEEPDGGKTSNYHVVVWYFCCYPLEEDHNGPFLPTRFSLLFRKKDHLRSKLVQTNAPSSEIVSY